MLLKTIILTLALASQTLSGSIPLGGSCLPSSAHLDPLTLKYLSECSDQNFCSPTSPGALSNGTCVPKQCRRDPFPFGHQANDTIPRLCPLGSFCPDDESGCLGLVPVGGACEVNRDTQCAEGNGWKALASPWNFNGSICLNSVCMYANATLNEPCVIDQTTYTIRNIQGFEQTYTFNRDNCQSPLLYCNQTALVCVPSKRLGESCAADQECQTHNCATVCANPPDTPVHVATWQYVIISVCVLGAMIATCILLTILDERYRFEQYREIRDYYFEQARLRREMIALHAKVVDRGEYSDDEKAC